MKKLFIILLPALVLLGGSSCKKATDAINKLTEFDMSYTSDFTVPGSAVTVTNTPFNYTSDDIATNSSTTFAAQKTVADKVTEIKLTRLNMSTDAGRNFDYLKTITIYLQAPNQPEQQIATKAVVPAGVSSVDLDLSDVNIKGYLTGTTFKLRVSAVLNGTNATDQKITLAETAHVKASLL